MGMHSMNNRNINARTINAKTPMHLITQYSKQHEHEIRLLLGFQYFASATNLSFIYW